MRTYRLAILSAVALLVGCQQNEQAQPAPSAAAAPSPTAPQPKPGDRVDVHGIVVNFLDGGAIKISGRDRWGNPLDTTYEDITFFRNALPVLDRSVSPEQAAGLRALVGAR